MVNKYDIIKLYSECVSMKGARLDFDSMVEYSKLITEFADIVTKIRKSNRWIERHFKRAQELHKQIKIFQMFY